MACKLSYEAKRLIVIGMWADIVITGGEEHPAFTESVAALYELVQHPDKESIEHLFEVLIDEPNT